MKHLSDYMQDKQTAVFNKYGAFFAFSQKQLNEQKKDGVKYADLGGGFIAPVKHASALTDELNKIHEDGIKQDIEENGIKAIIHRELANHECQISNDYSDALDALTGYGITEQQVIKEYTPFFQNCVANDYF